MILWENTMAKKPWNKNKTVGQKKPFTPDQVRLIKQILKAEGNLRDQALFSAGIDTMLRGSDLLKLTVNDVSDNKYDIKKEITIRQLKTSEGNLVMMSDPTRKILKQWINQGNKSRNDYLFTRLNKGKEQPITTTQYRRLVKKWAEHARADASEFSSHSLRRTKASLVYENTGNIEAVRLLLGQKSVASTSFYLNVDKRQALEIARNIVL